MDIPNNKYWQRFIASCSMRLLIFFEFKNAFFGKGDITYYYAFFESVLVYLCSKVKKTEINLLL